MTKFAMNNEVHGSTGLTPFFVSNALRPRFPVLLGLPDISSWWGGTPDELAPSNSAPATTSPTFDRGDTVDELTSNRLTSAVLKTAVNTAHTLPSTQGNHRPLNFGDTTRWVTESSIDSTRRSDHFRRSQRASPTLDSCVDASPPSKHLSDSAAIKAFIQKRHVVTRFDRDAGANAVEKPKADADKRGRTIQEKFTIGDKVLLSTSGIQDTTITNVGGNKLVPRCLGPFKRYHPSLLTTQTDASGANIVTPDVAEASANQASADPSRSRSPAALQSCAPFQCDGLPPLIDVPENLRWIVDRIVNHRDLKESPRHGDRRRDDYREQLDARLYRDCCIGFLAESHSRESL
uniref:Uncharacterized protein n=1 Tax=Peronospora matthiolae TaxID=2874970 RepID=A0AAV1TE21_9STRA